MNNRGRRLDILINNEAIIASVIGLLIIRRPIVCGSMLRL